MPEHFIYMRICKYCSLSEKAGNTSYSLFCFLYLKEQHFVFYPIGNKYRPSFESLFDL